MFFSESFVNVKKSIDFMINLFVCLSGRLPQGKESGYLIRDLASHPREVCNRVCSQTSRLVTFLIGLTHLGRGYCLGTNRQVQS